MERLSLQLYVDRIGSDRTGWDGMRSNDLQSDSGLGQHSQFLQHLCYIPYIKYLDSISMESISGTGGPNKTDEFSGKF